MRICQNCFLRLQRNTLLKNIFWKTIPHFFRTVSISFSDFRQKFYRGLSKLFSLCSENLLKMRIFSLFVFGPYWGFEQLFLTFGTNFFVKLSKLLSPCLDEQFAGKFYFRKVLQFIFGVWAKHSLNLVKIFKEKYSKTYPACSENILRKLFFRRIFWSLCILGLWVKVFLNFGNFFANLPKPHSKVQTNTLVSFFGKIHFSRFLVQTYSDVQRNINRKIVKTSFYLFRKPVEETDLFELFNVFRT